MDLTDAIVVEAQGRELSTKWMNDMRGKPPAVIAVAMADLVVFGKMLEKQGIIPKGMLESLQRVSEAHAKVAGIL